MKQLIKTTIFEGRLLLRDFITLFFSIIFPVAMLLLMGSIWGNEPQDMFNGYGSVDVLFSGYANMIIAVTGLMSLPLTLAQYREKKILKRLKVSPLHPFHLLLSQLIVNFILSIIGILLILVVGKIVFNLQFYGNVFEAILVYLLIVICVFTMGLLIASVANNMRTASSIAYLVYFPMLFLSGMTMPLDLMPKGIQQASRFVPMTYTVKLFQGVWLGKHLTDFPLALSVIFGFTLLCGGLSIYLFKWE